MTPDFIDSTVIFLTTFLVFLGGVLIFGLFNARYRFLKTTAEILELKPEFKGDSSHTAMLACSYVFQEALEGRPVKGQDCIPLRYFLEHENSYIQLDHAAGIPVLYAGSEIIRSEELIEHALLLLRSTVPVIYHPMRPHRNRLAAQELMESLAPERARDAS